MPYTSPATVSDGNVAPATWGNSVKAALDYLANPPSCRVYHNAAQSLASAAVAASAFNTERYDTDSMHDTVTNNSRITFTTAGLYLVTFTGSITPAADYTMAEAWLRMNGATPIAVGGMKARGDAAAVAPNLFVTTVYKFAAGDYVEAMIEHRNAAVAARSLLSAGNYSPEFAATWIGLG